MIGIPELEQPHTATPGPWELNGDVEIVSTHPEMDEVICSCAGQKIDAAFFSDVPGRAEANARLISAAPDLLAACREAEQRIMYPSTDRNKRATLELLRAAIAKATGNP